MESRIPLLTQSFAKYVLNIQGTFGNFTTGNGHLSMTSWGGQESYYSGPEGESGNAFNITVNIDTEYGGLIIKAYNGIDNIDITSFSLTLAEEVISLPGYTNNFEAGKQYLIKYKAQEDVAFKFMNGAGTIEYTKYKQNTQSIGAYEFVTFTASSTTTGLSIGVSDFDWVVQQHGLPVDTTFPSPPEYIEFGSIYVYELTELKELNAGVADLEAIFKWTNLPYTSGHDLADYLTIRNPVNDSIDITLEHIEIKRLDNWTDHNYSSEWTERLNSNRVLLMGDEPGLEERTGYVWNVEALGSEYEKGIILQNISVAAGAVYSFKADVNCKVGTQVAVGFFGNGAFMPDSGSYTTTTSLEETWETIEIIGYCTSTSTSATFSFLTTGAGDHFFVDNVEVRQVTPPDSLIGDIEVYTTSDTCEAKGKCFFDDGTDKVLQGLTTAQCAQFGIHSGYTTNYLSYNWTDPSSYEDNLEGLYIKERYESYNKKPALLRQISPISNFDSYTGSDDGVLELINNYQEEFDGSIDWKKHYFYVANNDFVDTGGDLPTIHTESNLTNQFNLRYSTSDSTELDTGILIDEKLNIDRKLLVVGETTPNLTFLNLAIDKPRLTSADTEIVVSVDLLDNEKAGISEYTVGISIFDTTTDATVPFPSLITDITGHVTTPIDISIFEGSIIVIAAVQSLDDENSILTQEITLTRIN